MTTLNPYEPNTFTTDGSTTTFQYTFDVLGTFSAILALLQRPDDEVPTLLTLGTDYTVNRSTKMVTMTTAPEDGSTLRIFRFTNRSRSISYIAGSTLTAPTMNNDADRLLSVDQEIEQALGDAFFNQVGDSQFMRKSFDGTYWDAQSIQIKNGQPGSAASSFTTLGQVLGLLSDTVPTFIDDTRSFCFTGDGATKRFRLQGAPIGVYSRTSMNVYVAHVRQSLCPDDEGEYIFDILNASDEGHTYHDEYEQFQEDGDLGALPGGYYEDPELLFSTAPEDGALIEAVFVFGTAQLVLPEAIIGEDQIAAGSIRVPFHIKPIDAGAKNRAMLFDAAGTPSVVDSMARVLTVNVPINSWVTVGRNFTSAFGRVDPFGVSLVWSRESSGSTEFVQESGTGWTGGTIVEVRMRWSSTNGGQIRFEAGDDHTAGVSPTAVRVTLVE